MPFIFIIVVFRLFVPLYHLFAERYHFLDHFGIDFREYRQLIHSVNPYKMSHNLSEHLIVLIAYRHSAH
jgi:hypothetical protein